MQCRASISSRTAATTKLERQGEWPFPLGNGIYLVVSEPHVVVEVHQCQHVVVEGLRLAMALGHVECLKGGERGRGVCGDVMGNKEPGLGLLRMRVCGPFFGSGNQHNWRILPL